jgi:4-aminobutyrate aminotransferase-like enzyme
MLVSSSEIDRRTETRSFRSFLEYGFPIEEMVSWTTKLVEGTRSSHLIEMRLKELGSEFPYQEGLFLSNIFNEGVERSKALAEELLKGKRFEWWNLEEYRKRVSGIFNNTSSGQFVNVLGQYALNRVGGSGPLMFVNHTDLFSENNDGVFLDALTNASVTNFGQGYPLHLIAANTLNRLTGGAQCPPYHPGPLMEEAASALLSVMPIETKEAKVAWFNSGGDAVSVAIAAAEKYTQITHGENVHRRKAIFFKEAYHGNIEGRAGKVTSGINQIFHAKDRNSIELEYPNKENEIEPVLNVIRRLINNDEISCVVFEATQGDGGGVSMQPDFFIELVKLSLDKKIPLIADEVQSGFGRSGKVFDVEYLLDHWRNSSYVVNEHYPEKPPIIIAVAKSMTNGVAPGSAVIFPKEYAVLKRAEGLNTYSAHPTTLAATIATVNLMGSETLEMVNHKRKIFEQTIAPYIGENELIKRIRGHGLHLFLELHSGINQILQIELLGRSRIITGTVSRDALRVHAPLNAPDIVWEALAKVIGETANQIKNKGPSEQTLKILNYGGPSGLAIR